MVKSDAWYPTKQLLRVESCRSFKNGSYLFHPDPRCDVVLFEFLKTLPCFEEAGSGTDFDIPNN